MAERAERKSSKQTVTRTRTERSADAVQAAKPTLVVEQSTAAVGQPRTAAVSRVGGVDVLTANEIAGWAWDPENPNEPIEVELLDGDNVVLCVLADRPRADLVRQGVGDGRHAFQVRPAAGFFPFACHRIRVRRKKDGIDLPGKAGWVFNPGRGLDNTAADFVTNAIGATVAGAKEASDLSEPIGRLLELLNQTVNAQRALEVNDASAMPLLPEAAHRARLTDWMHDIVLKLHTDYPVLRFERNEAPLVSIVVPVFNKFALTYACLKSIADNLPECPFEIVIVDDCSTDETMLCSLVFDGAVQVVRNRTNLNFVHSCNAGARAARGEYLFFLNNDTLMKERAVDELVATFANTPNVGIAGSKLLSADGTLQESGGVVWRLGEGWNWGRGQDPNDPMYNYLRDTDWVSGAALMIPRAMFEQLGGFDEHFAPAYYEDTDIAFRARAMGKRVVVQPKSEIVHLEGGSNGTDTEAGNKRHQILNQKKFYERWKDTLALHGFNGQDPERLSERLVEKRAYFIDESVPTPDKDAGSNAAFQHMLALMDLGYKVTFLPADNMSQIEPYTSDLQKLGIECLYAPFFWSVEEVFRKRKAVKPDLVYLHRHSNASKYTSLSRRYFPDARIVYSVADLHYLRFERQAELEADAKLKKKASSIKKDELGAMESVDGVIVHSSHEADLIRSLGIATQVTVVPWTIAPKPTPLSFHERSGFAFFAGFGHQPNVDAAHRLVFDIMPEMRKRTAAKLYIAGSQMPADVSALAAPDIGIVGYVPELADVLHHMRCTIVPLRYGAGIKGKVLESFAHGLPCVLSPIAAEGMDLPEALGWLIARTPDEFADKIAKLHEDEALNRKFAEAGLAYVTANFNRARIVAELRTAIGA